MTPRPVPVEDVVRPATVCAFAMIANQVAGKATRDALFLSSFDVELLPRMVGGAAIVTIAAVVAATRLLPRLGPRRLVPAAFAASAVMQLAIRVLMDRFPAAAAVLLYLHISVFGAVLISWFWSMITERFDPHTARLRIGRIAGGGTVGGLLGGIAAERAATALPVSSILLLLAALHLVCAGAAWSVGRGTAPGAPAGAARPSGEPSAWSVLRRAPYLRNLALLILSATAGGTLLDFVFKLRAQDAFSDGPTLLRFFVMYYTGVALVTFLLQSLLTRRLLETAGLARSASLLPGFLGIGGLAALLGGGLPAVGAVRGLESAVRSSLFRSSYELFYTPLPASEKRATKTLVDVGFDRLGDAVGAGLVQLVIALGIAGADRALLTGAAALGVFGLLITRRLHAGYVAALERNLVRHSDVARSDSEATEQTAFLEAITPSDLTETVPDLDTGLVTVGVDVRSLRESARGPERTAEPAAPVLPADPILEMAAALRSRDPARVRPALRTPDGLPPEAVPFAIPLLAWDAVAGDAQAALRSVCDRHVGQIVDALLDPDQEFTVRRRLPQVLARSSSPRAVRGLVAGLEDRRFEVRYQCGAALARVIGRNPRLTVGLHTVHEAVRREARVDRRVWESHRLLDEGQSPFSDEVLRERTSRSLEHVFTLLSLVYPAKPLRIAYRGLHTGDDALRGTSLEYLESILPTDIRDCLWPFLDDRRAPGARRPTTDALDSLLRSHETIQLRLDELQRDPGAPPTSPGGA